MAKWRERDVKMSMIVSHSYLKDICKYVDKLSNGEIYVKMV